MAATCWLCVNSELSTNQQQLYKNYEQILLMGTTSHDILTLELSGVECCVQKVTI